MTIQYQQISHGLPVAGDLRLERRLVELRITEGREGCGPALHRRDEALLADDDVRDVAYLAFRTKLSAVSASRHTSVERIAPQEKIRD